MNNGKINPPKRAIWFLRHACPGDNEALAGDLIERFREGQTRGWFWRQVFIVFFVRVLGEIRRHWPHLCYAIAGTAVTWFFWDASALRHVPGSHWSDLPWPWSQLVFYLTRPALFALAALPILAAGLVIERSFRWVSLLRTGVLNLVLITFGLYAILLFPWIWVAVMRSLYSFSFVVAAWLGCISPSSGKGMERLPHLPKTAPSV